MKLTGHSSVYNKTLEYVKTFAKFNTTDSASAVREYVLTVVQDVAPAIVFFILLGANLCFVTVLLRTLRREPQLTQFETAQIANLCPADAEEAKSIIPRCAASPCLTVIHG